MIGQSQTDLVEIGVDPPVQGDGDKGQKGRHIPGLPDRGIEAQSQKGSSSFIAGIDITELRFQGSHADPTLEVQPVVDHGIKSGHKGHRRQRQGGVQLTVLPNPHMDPAAQQ